MKVLGKEILDEFASEHGDVGGQLAAWIAEAESATWESPAEIRARYATASFLSDNRVIFNIKGNRYRLITRVNYRAGRIFVKALLTHAEYDRKEWMKWA